MESFCTLDGFLDHGQLGRGDERFIAHAANSLLGLTVTEEFVLEE